MHIKRQKTNKETAMNFNMHEAWQATRRLIPGTDDDTFFAVLTAVSLSTIFAGFCLIIAKTFQVCLDICFLKKPIFERFPKFKKNSPMLF